MSLAFAISGGISAVTLETKFKQRTVFSLNNYFNRFPNITQNGKYDKEFDIKMRPSS